MSAPRFVLDRFSTMIVRTTLSSIRRLAAVITMLSGVSSRALAEDLLEFRYTPVARAQVAIWVEDAAGNFIATVALTEAVAYRGIGNRPGASQMNSGYRWPYGRREGVLPIWAHRRAAAPGAKLFPRVIFQSRIEGKAARGAADPSDQSPDAYYCLSFQNKRSKRDQLDAISCASMLTSDKGRYITESDVAAGYVEPFEQMTGDAPVGEMHPLPLHSLYPPRMDVPRCVAKGCVDSPDLDLFASDTREVMPEIDVVTRATALGDTQQQILFTVPESWSAGNYVAFIEVNVEGDYNEHWNDVTFPTPLMPTDQWDEFAIAYGYPYRGQPSIVFSVPFELGNGVGTALATETPVGRSSWDHWRDDYGQLEQMSQASTDATALSDNEGSGVDRLRRDASGSRFVVTVRDSATRPPDRTIGAIDALTLGTHPDELRSHTWVTMQFKAPPSERPLFGYEVRVATAPITDEASFVREGRPAKTATDDIEGATALTLSADAPAGQLITTTIGDLVAQTHYYVAVRAINDMNEHGPLTVAEVTTTRRSFATVSPCFIATAAYGTPLANEIGVLRRFRDRHLANNALGRGLIAVYYKLGPHAAHMISRHEGLRTFTRSLISWLVSRIEP
jgi:hypothetical protein